MTLPVLLLLSIMTVRCSGCNDDLRVSVEKLLTTINNNHADFRKVFPVDYKILHHYNEGLLCTEPCCVFQAAAVLSDSWNQLYKNLWEENHKHSDVYDLKTALKHIKNERLQDEPEMSLFPEISSSPEELLASTIVLFSRWLEMKPHCPSPQDKCFFPTEPTVAEKSQSPLRSEPRLLTTRAIRQDMEWPQQHHKWNIAGHVSNGSPSSLQFPGCLGILLLWGLYSMQ